LQKRSRVSGTFFYEVNFVALPTAASVISSGLAGYPTVYYDRVALDTLVNNLWFYPACDLKVMPDMSGVAMQIFDF
jgi:hypothetical protein